MITVTVAGAEYRINKMNTMSQFHVGRRVAPMLFAMGAAGAGLLNTPPPQDEGDGLAAFIPMIAPVAEILSKMSDAESEYVIAECLGVVERSVGSERWGPVLSSDGKARVAHRIMFSDIDMRVMLRLVMESLQESLGDFWKGLGSAGASEPSEAGSPSTSSP